MRGKLLAAAALVALVPGAASAAPAAERRAAAAAVDIVGSDGASYRVELLLTHVLPAPEAALDATVTRCVQAACAVTTTRRIVPKGDFALNEQGTAARLRTRAFGTVISVVWKGDGRASTTLLTVRGGRSGAGAAVQEHTRKASARVVLAGLHCDTRQAQLEVSVFVGAGDTITERAADETPPGLLAGSGKTPRCAPS